jgi:hypothetical protein
MEGATACSCSPDALDGAFHLGLNSPSIYLCLGWHSDFCRHVKAEQQPVCCSERRKVEVMHNMRTFVNRPILTLQMIAFEDKYPPLDLRQYLAACSFEMLVTI